MKALAASALLIALLAVAKPVGAQNHNVISMGTLDADQPYTINIDNGLSAVGKAILTVRYLIGGKPASEDAPAKLGKATKFDILVFAAGARESSVQVIPKGTRLIVIDGAPPRNETVNIEVVQGSFSFTQACEGGCTLMFDLQ